jgi:hypothetical protein
MGCRIYKTQGNWRKLNLDQIELDFTPLEENTFPSAAKIFSTLASSRIFNIERLNIGSSSKTLRLNSFGRPEQQISFCSLLNWPGLPKQGWNESKLGSGLRSNLFNFS